MRKKTFLLMFVFGLMFLLAGGAVFAQSITVTAPAGGAVWCKGQTYAITWTTSGMVPANIKIRLKTSTSAGVITGNALDIVESYATASGSYSWAIPNSLPDGWYVMRIRSVDDSVNGDSAAFQIQNCLPPGSATITVTSPALGAEWLRGTTKTITWVKSGTMDANVKIRLKTSTSTGGITGSAPDIADNVPNNQSYSWTIPAGTPSGWYIVRVRTVDDAVSGDSAHFQITSGDGPGHGPDWDRIKDRLRKLVEIEWWRIRGPKWPWPNPCLSCPPEFGLDRIRDLLQDVLPNERIKLELFGPEGKLSDLGAMGKGVSLGRSFRMARVEKRLSEHLQAGKGFKLVVKNMAGEIIDTIPVDMKEINKSQMR